ncbi:hypothetical protein DMA11_12310 [Marinilabiliaceae bacterium JC017]|nr:hypothetical protein DMA11_12310 [Marinilabiliaceae bacterium JC017]
MIYAYDGTIQTKVNWKDYCFKTNDFSNNPWPYRTVMAPFFAKTKALIEYVLRTEDSLQIDSIIDKNNVVYKISIVNERIEFVGRLPIHINELGSNEGIVSEYVLYVNKKTNLPFKLQRTLPSNTMIEEISHLKINHLIKDSFSISNYIPSNMPRRSQKEENSNRDLLNSLAFNYKLQDMKGQFHSLEDVSSKVHVINITSLFCGPCNLSIPYLKELNQKYSEVDFSFVSLYQEIEKKGLEKYVNKNELKYEILLSDKQTLESYNINLTPTFIILDSNKKIRKIIYGFRKGKTETEIENAIKQQL